MSKLTELADAVHQVLRSVAGPGQPADGWECWHQAEELMERTGLTVTEAVDHLWSRWTSTSFPVYLRGWRPTDAVFAVYDQPLRADPAFDL